MERDFHFYRELVDVLSGVQIQLVPNTREGIFQFIEQHHQGKLFRIRPEDTLLRSLLDLTPGRIYEISGPADVQSAVFCSADATRLLMIGPCRQGKLTREEIVRQLQSLRMDSDIVNAFAEYCMQLPRMPYETLHSMSALLAGKMLQTTGPIPFQSIEYQWGLEKQLRLAEEEVPWEIEQMRIIQGRYEVNAALTEAVKHGNLSLAYRFIQKLDRVPHDLIRNPNPLRNFQNLCIIFNTQLRYALEEEGVSPYLLDQLSGSIARKIEQFGSVEAIQPFIGQMLRQYCQLAQERELKNMSPFARQAVTYIRSHLSDNLSVREAAKVLLVNPDYLSDRFHKEVGIPFITYVNRERIKQAAALLKHTDMQIQQISSAVGYNNTSYFSKQFLKFQGTTPRAYRKG